MSRTNVPYPRRISGTFFSWHHPIPYEKDVYDEEETGQENG
jgi:hypothetical protein